MVRQDSSGSIALVTGLILFVLFAGAGAAVDLGNSYRVHSRAQNAADAAALTAARLSGNPSQSDMTAIALKSYAANKGPSGMDFQLVQTAEGVRVTVTGQSDNYLLNLVGFDHFDLRVVSEVMVGTGRMEIALVLDNTGSMRPHITALRDAAKGLVNVMYDGQGDSLLSFSVVPYTGTVNVGNGQAQMAWMDVAGTARWHGRHFESRTVGETIQPCTPTTTSSGDDSSPDTSPGSALPGTDRGAWVLPDRWGVALKRYVSKLGAVLFGASAHAATMNDVPAGYGLYRDCYLTLPGSVNLFTDILAPVGEDWKGCVEARSEPFDVTDDAPDPSTPNTLFVPWVWPDEPDASIASAENFQNDYIDDKAGSIPQADPNNPVWMYSPTWLGGRLRAIHKYQNPVGKTTKVYPPITLGPNQGCPDAILPLTNVRSRIDDSLDRMDAWEGGGTNAAIGVAWGWRVLSPTAPFSEGQPYGDASKVIVLMTDGMNGLEPHGNDQINSEWSAYGYLRSGRLGKYKYSEMTQHINQRMLQTCTNAKAQGIQIFTVTFGTIDLATKSLYEQCSTDSRTHSFDATTVTDLQAAFQSIGRELSQTRIAK